MTDDAKLGLVAGVLAVLAVAVFGSAQPTARPSPAPSVSAVAMGRAMLGATGEPTPPGAMLANTVPAR